MAQQPVKRLRLIPTHPEPAGWLRWGYVAFGVDRLFRHFKGGCGAILMMHQVLPGKSEGWRGNPGLGLSVDVLERLVLSLRREGYALLTIDQAVTQLTQPESGRRRFACLTFDDGTRDSHDVLLPLLERLEVPATVYVTTGFIDRTVPVWWEVLEAVLCAAPSLDLDGGRLPLSDASARREAYSRLALRLRKAQPDERSTLLAILCQQSGVDAQAISDARVMTWSQTRRLAESGLVELGGHTVSHPDLSTLSLALAEREITEGRHRLQEMTGAPVANFAYPYGSPDSVTPALATLAARAGFRSAVIGHGGVVRQPASFWNLPRIGLGGHDDVAALRRRLSGWTGPQRHPASAR